MDAAEPLLVLRLMMETGCLEGRDAFRVGLTCTTAMAYFNEMWNTGAFQSPPDQVLIREPSQFFAVLHPGDDVQAEIIKCARFPNAALLLLPGDYQIHETLVINTNVTLFGRNAAMFLFYTINDEEAIAIESAANNAAFVGINMRGFLGAWPREPTMSMSDYRVWGLRVVAGAFTVQSCNNMRLPIWLTGADVRAHIVDCTFSHAGVSVNYGARATIERTRAESCPHFLDVGHMNSHAIVRDSNLTGDDAIVYVRNGATLDMARCTLTNAYTCIRFSGADLPNCIIANCTLTTGVATSCIVIDTWDNEANDDDDEFHDENEPMDHSILPRNLDTNVFMSMDETVGLNVAAVEWVD